MIAKKYFSREDTNIIKGVGILLIMIHNFFHIIPPSPGENEFLFVPESFDNFWRLLSSYPDKFIRYIFSYFGHYGVQLFIFISAYGLYRSYHKRKIRYFPFVKKRIIKLYPTLVIAVCLKLMIYLYKNQGFLTVIEIKSALLKLTLMHNFFPNEALTLSGPWWFFSLIVQFYLLFPLLVWVSKRFGSNILLIIGFCFLPIIYFFNPFFVSQGLNLNYTFIGHMEVFCLGIFFADKKRISVPSWFLVLAGIVFIFGNINHILWYFTFSAITILMIAGFARFLPTLVQYKRAYAFLSYTGTISLFIFAVHGMLRHPFAVVAGTYNNTWITLALCLGFVALTYLVSWCVQVIEKRVQKVIEKTPLTLSG